MVNLKAAFALVNKLKAIYENNEQFLALSLGLSIPKGDFELIRDINPANEQEADQARYNYAKLVNAVPEKSLAYNTTDQMLWDVFLDLLDPAQTEVAADRVLPDALKTKFEDAKRLVYQDYSTRTESALRLAYRAYKDVYDKLDYQIRMGDFDTEHNKPDQKEWTGIQRPELVKKRDEALSDWKSRGAKEAIEAALHLIESVEGQTPLSTWNKWKNKTLNVQACTAIEDGANYYMTGFSPGDFTQNEGCWSKFTLTAQAIQAAGQSAPPELMNLLAVSGNQSELEIESISFDVAVVNIDRPWLSEEVFKSDIWRFYQKDRRLSDGKTNPQGDLPAYSIKMVLAKNPVIKVKPSTSSPLNIKWLEMLKSRPLWLGPLKINQFKTEIDPKTVTTIDKNIQKLPAEKGLFSMVKVNPALLNMRVKGQEDRKNFGIASAKVETLRIPVIKANDFRAKNEQAQTYQKAQINWSNLQFTNLHTTNIGSNVSTGNVGTIGGTTVKPQTSTVLTGTNVLTSNTVNSSVLTGVTLGGFKRGAEGAEEYQILGFICKALPKSPNPNANLVWV